MSKSNLYRPKKKNEPVILNRVVENEQKPHVCPVCNGTGKVPGGFYRQNFRGEWSSATGEPNETCRSCQGTGIVWH